MGSTAGHQGAGAADAPGERDGAARPAAARDALARFGTAEPVAAPRRLALGPVSLLIADGGIRALAFEGTEIVRGLTYPVRDADWGTLPTLTTREDVSEAGLTLTYRRLFTVADAFEGEFRLTATREGGAVGVAAHLTLAALRDVVTNRAGFTVLHPLAGVAGERARARRPDGSTAEIAFPRLISPAQPVRDLAGLSHTVDGVAVDIAFEGEVFEMEDQRNWTDASFKTYCRPLAAPRPFTVAAGERIEQAVTVRLRRAAPAAAAAGAAAASPARLPEIMLAVDEALAPTPAAAVADIPFAGALVRVRPDTARDGLAAVRALALPATLEVVIPAGADPAAVLATVAGAAAAVDIAPARIVALPDPYLASIQPEGPWPTLTPEEAAAAARAAFPAAETGAGMLTYFTELNRRRPQGGAFLTFGTAAIVHAADDASVLQTLETLPDVFASAAALAGERPLRLGLVGIAMRSNPYGAATAANPEGRRVPMALADPRQRGLFAAAFAVGAVAAAASAGIASLSLGMASGPLGLTDRGAARPLFHVARALARLGPAAAMITGGPGGLVEIAAADMRILANLGSAPATVASGPAGLVHLSPDTVPAARDPHFLDRAHPAPATLTLAPLDVAFLTGSPS